MGGFNSLPPPGGMPGGPSGGYGGGPGGYGSGGGGGGGGSMGHGGGPPQSGYHDMGNGHMRGPPNSNFRYAFVTKKSINLFANFGQNLVIFNDFIRFSQKGFIS